MNRARRSNSCFRATRLAFGVLALLIGGAISRAASAISIEPISNPSGVRVAVTPTSNAGWALLEVVDPSSGVVVRTIHAGRITARDHFAVVANDALPAGPYRLRYRENVDLALAGELKRPDPAMPSWLNPTDLALVGPWIYVRDGGQAIEAKDPASTAEKAAKQSCIIKMDRNGNADPSFGKDGKLVLQDLYNLRSIAVDPANGKIYLGSGSHFVRVLEANGEPAKQTVGGWDNDPHGPKCTVWCDSIALGWKDRIYICMPGYANGKAYDRTKNGFDGVLYKFDIPDVNGLARMICSDGKGAVYMTGQSMLFSKFVDDDKSLKLAYQTKPEEKLSGTTGGSASGGLVWFACRGPGFGPYWDSGGGGEVVLYWDTGKELRLVDRFGMPGTAADRVEFLNPSAVVMDQKHNEVWIVEDGAANKEGPKGNARVRRFEMKAHYSEEADFSLPK